MRKAICNIIFLYTCLQGLPFLKCQLSSLVNRVHNNFCQNGWLQHQNHCYYASSINNSTGKTKVQAETSCRLEGGWLVKILSKEEHEFIYLLLERSNAKMEFWIGEEFSSRTNDTKEETSWSISSVKAKGQRSFKSATKTTCVLISALKHGYFIADSCEEKRGYICKKSNEASMKVLACNRCKRMVKSRMKRSYRFKKRGNAAMKSLPPPDGNQPSLNWGTMHLQSDVQNLVGGDIWEQDHDDFNVLHPWRPIFRPTNPSISKKGSEKTDFAQLGNHGRFASPFHSKFSDTFLNQEALEEHRQKAHKILKSFFGEPIKHRLRLSAKDGASGKVQQLVGNFNHFNPTGSSATVPIVFNDSGRSRENSTTDNTLATKSNIAHKNIEAMCEENDVYYNGSCYSVPNAEDSQSYSQASSACTNRHTHLVFINDSDEHKFIAKLLNNLSRPIPVWIAFNVTTSEGRNSLLRLVDDSQTNQTLKNLTGKGLTVDGCIALSKKPTDEEMTLGINDCQASKYSYICEYEPSTGLNISEECLEGWEEVDQLCYKAFFKPASWTAAERECTIFGGHLTTTSSVEEEEILRRLSLNSNVSEFFTSLWIGLQIASEDNYLWSEGSTVGYLNWAEGEPDFHREMEHCGSATRRSFRVHDSPCNALLPFICKATKGTMLITEQLSQKKPETTCEDNPTWLSYDDHCYKIISSKAQDPRTWWDARHFCREIGGELASIHSAEENYWIQSKVLNLSDSVLWIGGLSYLDSGYEWVDRTPFDYTNWAKGEPNNNYDQEDCVSFYTYNFGYWNDQNCAHTQGWVCKRPFGATHPPPVTTSLPEGNCPIGWIDAGTKCLRFFTYRATFDDARMACKMMDPTADLASVATHKEQAYLTAAMGELKTNMWIGLRYERGYHWVDQSALKYTNWAQGEPSSSAWDDPEHNENCVSLHTHNLAGKWNNIYCKAHIGYVCQMMLDPTLPSSNFLPYCASPFETYFNHSGNCYRPETNAISWEEAEKTCFQEGSHLASAVNRAESAWLWVLTQTEGLEDPWMGLSNKKDDRVFAWSDSWPTIYTKWGHGEPNVTISNSTCVRLGSEDGLWYAENCNATKPFICKQNNEVFPTPDPFTGGSCPDQRWIDFGGSYCYLFSTDESPWDDANQRCAQLGSNLTSIHSKAEMDLIVQAAHNLRDPIWIGLVQMKDGFGWSDGTGYDFVNWQEGEPNSGGEECIEIYPGTGVWNDAFCSNARHFICKIAKDGGIVNSEHVGTPAELKEKYGSSAGTIAGIVVSVFLLVFGGFVFLLYRQKNPKPIGNSGAFGFDNAVYSEDEDCRLNLNSIPIDPEEEEEEAVGEEIQEGKDEV